MQKFDLSLWLQDKSRKVVTRDGRPVRIVCWDLLGEYKIIAVTDESDEGYTIINKKVDGTGGVSTNDLFFADEEEGLTEFERELEMMMVSFSNGNLGSDVRKEMPKQKLHDYAHRLLEFARKEIEKENSEFKPKFTYNEKDYSKLANKLIEFRNNTPLCSVSYREGEGRNVILHYEKEIFELVKNEILKDLPKWKKITEAKQNYLSYGYLSNDEYYLSIQELKDKLPKE